LNTFVAGLLAVGLGSIAFAGAHESSASGATPTAPSQLDVEIAIDGTASMATAIARAKQAGAGITDGVISLLPDTRFSVVVFRDHGNPAGEYELLQPFTGDPADVKAALGRIKTAFNPSPDNGPAESYNLAFRRSYSDDQMGWRPSARKIVLVLGDAEPNGAGTENLSGCHDHSKDPEGLSTRQELANMRAAARTLVMVREPSNEVTVSLQCYQALSAGAYVGGLAEDAGGDLVASIVELIQSAYAPLSLKPDLRTAVRSGRAGYTVRLQNPNILPLTIASLEVTLPRGLRYVPGTSSGATRTEPAVVDQKLTWSFTKTVAARKQLLLHLDVRTPRRLGTYRSSARASVETAAGNHLAPHAASDLHVRRRISAIAFGFGAGPGTVWRVTGGAAARFRTHTTKAPGRGSVVVRMRGKGAVKLRVTRLQLERLMSPTRARLALRVVSAHGFARCRVGTHVTLHAFASSFVRADGSTGSYVRLLLPRPCGGTISQPAMITVTDR
jgi:hypothetical protein